MNVILETKIFFFITLIFFLKKNEEGEEEEYGPFRLETLNLEE
jgi:hypothetical protein